MKPIALRRNRLSSRLVALAMVLAAAGYSVGERVETAYGRTGGVGGRSVNGISVLADMFEKNGYTVTTVDRLTPRLNQVDIIVWAPDDFEPPTGELRTYLENWLESGTGRTLVYIGRDYDAAIAYWRTAMPLAPPERAAEFQRRQAKAVTDFDSARKDLPAEDADFDWFRLDVDGLRRKATALEGPWADGVDASKTQIEYATRLAVPSQSVSPGAYVPYEYQVLLSSSEEPLVIAATAGNLGDGQIISVVNGSFLLNYPLVNKEHRVLAQRLIDQCDTYKMSQSVVFVESGQGGPPIHKREDVRGHTGFEMLVVWPIGPIAVHTALWLLVCCVSLYPIFGRPRENRDSTSRVLSASDDQAVVDLGPVEASAAVGSTGDFGKHLTAMGELLSLTKDATYATEKIRYYQQNVKRDSGASHIGPPGPVKKA